MSASLTLFIGATAVTAVATLAMAAAARCAARPAADAASAMAAAAQRPAIFRIEADHDALVTALIETSRMSESAGVDLPQGRGPRSRAAARARERQPLGKS